MIKTSLALVAVVLVVAVCCSIHFDSGVEGNVVVYGPVCCTVTPAGQASYGFSQLNAVTETVQCQPTQSMKSCCFTKLADKYRSYVLVNGAFPGECGSQTPFT